MSLTELEQKIIADGEHARLLSHAGSLKTLIAQAEEYAAALKKELADVEAKVAPKAAKAVKKVDSKAKTA